MKKSVKNIIYFVVCVLLIGLDQLSKAHIVKYLKFKENDIVWVKNVFVLQYVENDGAAFSSFAGKQTFLLILTSLVLLFVIVEFLRIPNEKKYGLLRVDFMLIIAGAVGNMIDRIRQGYVVDFFYFVPVNFPRFNVADVYVTVAMVLLLILMIGVYKEDSDTEFLFKFRKK